MEGLFGHDLSAVRVHTGPRAGELNRGLRAQASTLGRDVFFAPGRFAPETAQGRALVAHELAHTVQQRSGPAAIQRQPDGRGMPSPAELIESFTSKSLLVFDDLQEEALAGHLVGLAQSPANLPVIQNVLARLDDDNRVEVATEFVRRSPAASLSQLAQSESGVRLLLDLLGAVAAGGSDGDLAARILLRALFPPPPPLAPSDLPVFKISDGRVEVVAYERGGVFRSPDGRIIGERGLESTLSPMDFLVPGAFAARALLNLGRAAVSNAVRALLTSATSRGLIRLTPKQIATAGVAAEGAFTSGVIGAGFNVGVQLATLDDLRKFDWGAVGVDFVLGALLSAYAGQVISKFPTKTQGILDLFKAENLAQLAKQQGLIAPVTFIANSIRAAVFDKSQGAAFGASVLETALGAAQSGVVQALLRGKVGDLIFKGSKIAVEDRIRSGQAAVLKKALSIVRATLPRLIFGLLPGGKISDENKSPTTR
jgi:hypothetical protein